MTTTKRPELPENWWMDLKERARVYKQQRDTVAEQWQTVNTATEQLTRTCLYCDFLAQSRASLKTHLRYKHQIGTK